MIISDNLKIYVQKLRSSNLRPTKQRLKICQFLFRWIHPDIGIPLGRFLSGSKRMMNISDNAKRNDKRIIHYCNEYRKKENIDTFLEKMRHG